MDGLAFFIFIFYIFIYFEKRKRKKEGIVGWLLNVIKRSKKVNVIIIMGCSGSRRAKWVFG